MFEEDTLYDDLVEDEKHHISGEEGVEVDFSDLAFLPVDLSSLTSSTLQERLAEYDGISLGTAPSSRLLALPEGVGQETRWHPSYHYSSGYHRGWSSESGGYCDRTDCLHPHHVNPYLFFCSNPHCLNLSHYLSGYIPLHAGTLLYSPRAYDKEG
jgi:hypothetical protein